VVRSIRRVDDDNDVPTEPGTYRRVYDYWADHCAKRGRPNTYWAEICCPGCKKVALLGSNHIVKDDGAVHPSDVCPFPPCTFHEFIQLDDWARPSTPRRSASESDDGGA
jgi:hypothetical protein